MCSISNEDWEKASWKGGAGQAEQRDSGKIWVPASYFSAVMSAATVTHVNVGETSLVRKLMA